jgi:hypothetical protein
MVCKEAVVHMINGVKMRDREWSSELRLKADLCEDKVVKVRLRWYGSVLTKKINIELGKHLKWWYLIKLAEEGKSMYGRRK